MTGQTLFLRRRHSCAATLVLATALTGCGGGKAPAQPSKGGAVDAAVQALASAGEAAESVVATVRQDLGFPVEPSPAAVPSAPEAPKADAKAPTPRRARPVPVKPVAESPAAPVAEALVADTGAEPSPATTADEAPVDELDSLAELVEPIEKDTRVYTANDVDVVPPRPPLGSPLRPWRTSATDPGLAVEVTVADDGTVEKVHMLGAPRLTDATLLSHIKAWQFTPALRDNQPVRYRLLLRDPIVAP